MMRPASLYTIIALTGLVFLGGIFASHVTQALALLINSYHMLYNFLSLLVLVVSQRMSKGKTLKNTFGWVRLKVLGMLVNMLFLCALCFAAFIESIQTVVHASHENTVPRYPWIILGLGVSSFLVNLICFILIGGYTHHQGCSMITKGNVSEVDCVLIEADTLENGCTDSMNRTHKKKCSNRKYRNETDCPDHKVLDLTRDMSSCLAAIACAAIVILIDGLLLKYVDAILTMAAVVVLLATTYSFIRESGLILLQSIPNHIDVDSLTTNLKKEFPLVQNVHDLHVWRLTVSEIIATVHIILASPSVYISISSDLKSFFKKEGISMVTIQPEFHEGKWSSDKCILRCSANNNCGAFTCCGPLTENENSAARLRCLTNSKPEENVVLNLDQTSC